MDEPPGRLKAAPTWFWRLSGRWSTPRLDLHGNVIERAVGDCRTDPYGDLYERHAPDTAIPTLRPGV